MLCFPPESPLYRGHRSKASAAQVTKPAQPSSSKKTGTAQTRKTKEQPPNPKPAETNVEKQKKKKTNKKQRTALQDLAEEQDKLYAELHKVARKSKWTVRSRMPILVAFRNFHAQLKPLNSTFTNP